MPIGGGGGYAYCAVLTAVIVGAASGLAAGAPMGVAIPDSVVPPGIGALLGLIAFGIGLPILVARLVPRRL